MEYRCQMVNTIHIHWCEIWSSQWVHDKNCVRWTHKDGIWNFCWRIIESAAVCLPRPCYEFVLLNKYTSSIVLGLCYNGWLWGYFRRLVIVDTVWTDRSLLSVELRAGLHQITQTGPHFVISRHIAPDRMFNNAILRYLISIFPSALTFDISVYRIVLAQCQSLIEIYRVFLR